jgi:alpha/beta superfamily hydrolase
MFRIALSLIAFRILDDNFLQPAAGTSATDHLASALVPLALLALAAWLHPRLRAGAQGALAIVVGIAGIATGVDAIHYARATGLGSDDISGFLAIAGALLLFADAAHTLWRSRRAGRWRYARRAGITAGGLVAAALLVLPFGTAYVGARVATAGVPADHLGAAHETVTFETNDGLTLEGWYIPSRNGAAIISFPGRKGPQRQARMLARHGYGVLVFDRRGEGRSEGTPDILGWGGDEDIKAAIRYLQHRPDVDPKRIGGIGLSVGGELMLETAAETPDLAAVVSEGAGARTMAEEVDDEAVPARDRLLTHATYALRDAVHAVATNRTPPQHLKTLVPKIAPRPLLLIADPESRNGEKLNRLYYKTAREPKALWEIPHAGHVNGIAARPAEYERRVVDFFDHAL